MQAFLYPLCYGGFIALGGATDRLLVTPTTGFEQSSYIIGMIPHPELAFYHESDALTGPHIATKAETLCAACEQGGYLGALHPGKATRCAAGGAFLEGLCAFFSPALDPLADGSWGDIEFIGDVLLLPALLVELPGTQAAAFAPILTLL